MSRSITRRRCPSLVQIDSGDPPSPSAVLGGVLSGAFALGRADRRAECAMAWIMGLPAAFLLEPSNGPTLDGFHGRGVPMEYTVPGAIRPSPPALVDGRAERGKVAMSPPLMRTKAPSAAAPRVSS